MFTYKSGAYGKISTAKVHHTLDIVALDEGSDHLAVRADRFLPDRSISRTEGPVVERPPGVRAVNGRKGFPNR
jgi:hypothetical protein